MPGTSRTTDCALYCMALLAISALVGCSFLLDGLSRLCAYSTRFVGFLTTLTPCFVLSLNSMAVRRCRGKTMFVSFLALLGGWRPNIRRRIYINANDRQKHETGTLELDCHPGPGPPVAASRHFASQRLDFSSGCWTCPKSLRMKNVVLSPDCQQT